MVITKRQQRQMERQLIASLTDACESAKTEIPGFNWLTHDNGNQAFPAGFVLPGFLTPRGTSTRR